MECLSPFLQESFDASPILTELQRAAFFRMLNCSPRSLLASQTKPKIQQLARSG